MTDRSWIAPDLITFGEVELGNGIVIEPSCIIGKPNFERERQFHSTLKNGSEPGSYFNLPCAKTIVRDGAYIASGCIILEGAELDQGVELEDRIRIGSHSFIGAKSRVMYEALVYNRVRIGERCNISGFVCNETVIEDDVSFFGKTVHSYREHIAPGKRGPLHALGAPRICTGAIVGMDALLIGPITIGRNAYIAAGARISADIAENSFATSNNDVHLREK